MKKLFFGLLFIGTFSTGVAAEIAPDCTYQGIRLYGRVKVVDFMPDFTIQYVDFMPDFTIQFVHFMPGL